MAPAVRPLSEAGDDVVHDLLRWRPEHGVLSIYIRIQPGERSPAWHTEVRNALSAVADQGGTGNDDRATALEKTAGRLERELLEEPPRSESLGLIGFVEVARKSGEERWYTVQIQPPRTEVFHEPVAQIHALLELLDDGAPLGVAVVSAERIRLFDWRLGRIESLHDRELEFFAGDWRERKAQKSRDPAKGEGVSAAGRDQYNQRLEDTREHFAREAGEQAQREAGGRGWRETLVFGDERYVRKFCDGADTAFRHVSDADLISEPTHEIERRIEAVLPELNREREGLLIERIKEAAYAEGRSSLGVEETRKALEEGRVEHLVYDAERAYAGAEPDGPSEIEQMIERALATKAAITPVEGESATALADQGGVAALLRY